jgi:hypothetical protein
MRNACVVIQHCRIQRVRASSVALVCAILWGSACHNGSTPAPSTTTTTTAALPTITETFSGTVQVASYRFYSFQMVANGTVNTTLESVTGAGVPATVQLLVGIGQPSATDCNQTTTGTVAPGGLVTGTFGPGTFCVRVSDVGNLFAPADFVIQIQH